MAEKTQSLGRGQASAAAPYTHDPRNYTQLQQGQFEAGPMGSLGPLHQPPVGQFEGSLGQYSHQYTMPVGKTESGQRKTSYDTSLTSGQPHGYGDSGRERLPTWPGLQPQLESGDSSDVERQSDTKSTDTSHAQADTFDDDIGSSVSTRYSAKPKVNTGQITIVPSTTEIMDDHPSYHQSITAKEAERRLKMFDKDCCYLTRYSKTHKYVLSVFRKQWPNDAIEHFNIVIDDKGKYKVKGNKDKTFDGIESLLLHYESRRISPGFPKIGQGYREEEFNKQQQKIIDDEKRREEEEKKRKEDEQNRLKQLEEKHDQLLKELQETRDAAEQQKQEAEDRRLAELKEAEDRRQAQLKQAEDRRQAQLQDAEDRRQAELKQVEDRRQAQLKEAEDRRQAELKQVEDRRQAQLKEAEDRRQAELKQVEDRRQADLRAAENKRLREVQEARSSCTIL